MPASNTPIAWGNAMTNAENAARFGDTIIAPGMPMDLYTNYLGKNGVTYILNGTTLIGTNRVFSDMGRGAMNITVAGSGTLLGWGALVSSAATVYFTNSASMYVIDCNVITNAGYAALHHGEANGTINAKRLIRSYGYDGIWGDAGSFQGKGVLRVTTPLIQGGNNGIEIDGGNVYIDAQTVVADNVAGQGAQTILCTGGTNNFRIFEIIGTNVIAGSAMDVSGGTNYLDCVKASGGMILRTNSTTLHSSLYVKGMELTGTIALNNTTETNTLTLNNVVIRDGGSACITASPFHKYINIIGALGFVTPPNAGVHLSGLYYQWYPPGEHNGSGNLLTNLAAVNVLQQTNTLPDVARLPLDGGMHILNTNDNWSISGFTFPNANFTNILKGDFGVTNTAGTKLVIFPAGSLVTGFGGNFQTNQLIQTVTNLATFHVECLPNFITNVTFTCWK